MNKLILILGLGTLFYFIKKKNAPLTVEPTPTEPKEAKGKPKATKPKKATEQAPIVPPPFKINDVLIPRPPRKSDTAYTLPFGKAINPVKEGLYLGYSSQYKNWIKLRVTFYTGTYQVPTTSDVWVNLNNWIKK